MLEALERSDRKLVSRRFFSPKKELSDRELENCDVDFGQVFVIVVTTQGADGEILIGGGRYATEGAGSGQAEMVWCYDEEEAQPRDQGRRRRRLKWSAFWSSRCGSRGKVMPRSSLHSIGLSATIPPIRKSIVLK